MRLWTTPMALLLLVVVVTSAVPTLAASVQRDVLCSGVGCSQSETPAASDASETTLTESEVTSPAPLSMEEDNEPNMDGDEDEDEDDVDDIEEDVLGEDSAEEADDNDESEVAMPHQDTSSPVLPQDSQSSGESAQVSSLAGGEGTAAAHDATQDAGTETPAEAPAELTAEQEPIAPGSPPEVNVPSGPFVYSLANAAPVMQADAPFAGLQRARPSFVALTPAVESVVTEEVAGLTTTEMPQLTVAEAAESEVTSSAPTEVAVESASEENEEADGEDEDPEEDLEAEEDEEAETDGDSEESEVVDAEEMSTEHDPSAEASTEVPQPKDEASLLSGEIRALDALTNALGEVRDAFLGLKDRLLLSEKSSFAENDLKAKNDSKTENHSSTKSSSEDDGEGTGQAIEVVDETPKKEPTPSDIMTTKEVQALDAMTNALYAVSDAFKRIKDLATRTRAAELAPAVEGVSSAASTASSE